MARVDTLKLCPERGVIGDANPERSPRQVSLAFADSLAEYGVSAEGARSNLILQNFSDGLDGVAPGALMISECDVAIRVTMVCEPCRYGAGLAGSANRIFRNIRRYLCMVVHGGTVLQGSTFEIWPDVYLAAPNTFAERVAWALDFIPEGRYVTTVQFLQAIGAGNAYARALPGWLRKAQEAGKSVHWVLTAQLSPGSWEHRSLDVLYAEGVRRDKLSSHAFHLMSALWFDDSPTA